jgi:phage FluMu protein Com
MIEQENKFFRELRCAKCRRLLALEYVFRGRIAIKCKCGELNRIEFKTPIKRIAQIEAQSVISNEIVMKKETTNLKGGDR